MNKFFYFAYGSNMLGERLKARCPSAVFVGPAYVCGYELQFSKRSIDCSGKATIVESKDSFQKLYGAIFQIDESEIGKLDKAEGSGYERRDDFVVVKLDDGREIRVTTYIAKPKETDASLVPFDWYKNLVIAGAHQSGLPESYISKLERYDSVSDPVATRKSFVEAQSLLDRLNDAK